MNDIYEDEGYHPLPNKLFLIRVPAICTYDEAELDLFGRPVDIDSSGKKYKDIHNNLVTVMLPLDRIINIYASGYSIALVNKEDVTILYNMLEKYLRGIVNAERYSPNFRCIEEDRLPDIEKFANEMFDLNKGTIVGEVISKRNNNPFGLGLNLMDVKTPKHVIEEMKINTNTTGPVSSTGIMSDYSVGYKTQPTSGYNYNNIPSIPQEDNYSYIYDNMQDLNLNTVVRHSIFKKKFD